MWRVPLLSGCHHLEFLEIFQFLELVISDTLTAIYLKTPRREVIPCKKVHIGSLLEEEREKGREEGRGWVETDP